MSDIRCKVGYVGTTTAKINCATLSDTTITATCSGGTVVVNARSQRVASPYLGTCLIEITGLTANTKYFWTVTQGAVERSGSFRTLPADQVTDFSFFVTTCDKAEALGSSDATFGRMKEIVQTSEIPVLFRIHPDDLSYIDDATVNDTETGFATSGAPQTTTAAEDYAITWAATYGLFRTEGKWRHRDRQWLDNNLPLQSAIPGDHGFEGNHCRGQIGESDYHGCDRTNIEPNAKAEWDKFYGQMFSDPLTLDLMDYAFECGPCRFGMMDLALTATPYDGVDTTKTGYGTQITDVFTYLDVPDVQFKFAFLDTGFQQAGQPWGTFWATEANDWKTNTLDASDNLNGTSGNFIGFYGDSHAQQVWAFDTFWAFGAGMIDSNSVFSQSVTSNWSGVQEYWRGAKSKTDGVTAVDSTSGLRKYGGFIHVIVYASQTPKKVEVRHMDKMTGKILRAYSLTANAVDNQMTDERSKLVTI